MRGVGYLLLTSVELASSSGGLPGEAGKGSQDTLSGEQVSRIVVPSASPTPFPHLQKAPSVDPPCQQGLEWAGQTMGFGCRRSGPPTWWLLDPLWM